MDGTIRPIFRDLTLSQKLIELQLMYFILWEILILFMKELLNFINNTREYAYQSGKAHPGKYLCRIKIWKRHFRVNYLIQINNIPVFTVYYHIEALETSRHLDMH